MPVDDTWTKEELDLLVKALVNLPVEVKDKIRREIRMQSRGAVPARTVEKKTVLEKLGYDELPDDELS